MTDRTLSNEFLVFFRRYSSFYEELLHLETKKYNDIIANNFDTLNNWVKSEEAYMLKLRGFEQERIKLMNETENPKATFRELIPLLDESTQEEAQLLYNNLSQILQKLKHLNLKNNYLIKLKLRKIEKSAEMLKTHPELRKSYNAQALKNTAFSHTLSKKV